MMEEIKPKKERKLEMKSVLGSLKAMAWLWGSGSALGSKSIDCKVVSSNPDTTAESKTK